MEMSEMRTLKEMLILFESDACWGDGQTPRTCAEAVIRCAAEVARNFHPGMFQPGEVRNARDVYIAIAEAILRDAGLEP